MNNVNSMQKISVVISAYNESRKIRDCLKSVKGFADEIIVVDNSSTDGTATIAKSFGAKTHRRINNLMLNVNKNFGFTKAKNDWILNLDADERLTDELKTEIATVLAEELPEDVSAFAIPRKNIIFGKWIEHTGWYPDYQLRLFRKSKGQFLEKHVHEQLDVDGKIQNLLYPMLHESYSSIREFLLKFFVIYAPNEAEQLMKTENYQYRVSDFVARPWSEFIKRFQVEKGYKDGLHGLILSLLMAFYHFVVICYVWEKKKFSDLNENVENVLETQLIKSKKEYTYWKRTNKMHDASNLFKKSVYRIQRKIGQ